MGFVEGGRGGEGGRWWLLSREVLVGGGGREGEGWVFFFIDNMIEFWAEVKAERRGRGGAERSGMKVFIRIGHVLVVRNLQSL